MTTNVAAVCVTILGCVGIGAYLATEGHPWFALLAMIIGGAFSYKENNGSSKEGEEV